MSAPTDLIKDLVSFLLTPITPDQVAAMRQSVLEETLAASTTMRSADFSSISGRDLTGLLRRYDEAFFGGVLDRLVSRPRTSLRLRLSRRMTSNGGLTTWQVRRSDHGVHHDFDIAISTTLLFNTDFANGNVLVTGVPVDHRLDGLARIFEHELIHLSEMLAWSDSSCARPRFRGIAHSLFGHRESNHQLTTPTETAGKHHGIRPGDCVEFRHQGQRLRGIVNRIYRRATVIVPDPSGELYDDGRHYRRYYVPLALLSRVPARDSA